MPMLTLVTAIAGVAFGLVGTVLGIVNTWLAFRRDAVRVKVVPVRLLTGDGSFVGITVINESNFAVTVTGVGFTRPSRNDSIWLHPKDAGVPHRLEARTQHTAVVPLRACEGTDWALVELPSPRLRVAGDSPGRARSSITRYTPHG